MSNNKPDPNAAAYAAQALGPKTPQYADKRRKCGMCNRTTYNRFNCPGCWSKITYSITAEKVKS